MSEVKRCWVFLVRALCDWLWILAMNVARASIMRRYESDLWSFKFVIPKPFHLHFLTHSVSFNHVECSDWTHLSLEFNSPFHWGLCSSAVSLMRSITHAKITKLPPWQKEETMDSTIIAMATWAGSPVWYCTLSLGSLLLRGWEFRPLCSLENGEVRLGAVRGG